MTNTGELTAPEAFVLMSLPRYDGRKALKLGFLGLLAQGVLRIEEESRPGLFRSKRIVYLREAPDRPLTLPAASGSLVQVVHLAAPAGGVMSAIVKASMREYGRSLLGFVQNYVISALVARRLAEKRPRRLLGFIPSEGFFRTPAGEAEKIRLEAAMQGARTIPQYLDRDPTQAAALAAAAGGTILLIDELRPYYQQLALALQPRDGGAFTGSDSGFDFGSFDFASCDLGSFDFGCFDSFDAGFDAGFDGGGDGGGGDGGGSGC